MRETIAQALAVIAVGGMGIVAGVFFAVAVSVLPTLNTLPAGSYVALHRKLGQGYHPSMPLIVNSTMIADIALIFLVEGTTNRLLFVLASVLALAVQGVSHFGNVPINRSMLRVDPDAVPDDWNDPRPQWRRLHRLRTALSLAALTVTAVGVVVLP
ncbi:anthrone oxygenase family protein [Micromonospora sp. NPDC050187]|uniref:anthrone oxygenase family protein n=1 Tax=Micromonospora sp. NPDC050187 TaxID=3364277 RepID=UPI00379F2606